MFFNLVLLNRQHKARFGTAWIAATRGIKYVSKREVLELNIDNLCDEISDFVSSESDAPRARFSLRLSAILINGTLKLYRQKSIYIIQDVVKFLSYISRLAIIEPKMLPEVSGIFDTPSTPIIKTKSKKRPRSEKSTPQSQLDKLVQSIRAQEVEEIELPISQVQLEVVQARADEVTLRETQIFPQEQLEEFGALGAALPTDEELLREITRLEKELPSRLPSLQPIEEVPELLVEGIAPLEGPLSRRRPRMVSSESSPSDPDVGPKVITVQAQIHVSSDVSPAKVPRLRREKSPVVTEVPVEEVQVQPVGAEKPQEKVSPVRKRIIFEEMEVAAVEERDKKIQKIRKTPRDKVLKKLKIVLKSRRVVRINRCEKRFEKSPKHVVWRRIRLGSVENLVA